ncbi:unnamed protein product [Phaedon cochleariae]|uniref:Methuselah N-terminal domain-containing protein n=1 Tax=Phaedon cochleariae TaxID=80249 RepID=A0A9P0GV25_PHACE|nr:unnamed protein product [Phaedon cochleariae]
MKLPLTPSVCLLIALSLGQELPCPINLSVNISDGSPVPGGIEKDNVTYPQKDIFTSGGVIWGCVCNFRKCIRKCCAQNETKVHGQCVKDIIHPFEVIFYEEKEVTSVAHLDDFFIIYGSNKCDSNFSRYSPDSGADIFMQPNGKLLFHEEDSDPTYFDPQDYCLDVFNNESSAFLCDRPDPVEDMRVVNLLGMIISMPFLLLTFLVYVILPETSLHRRALMSYVLTLLVGYILLVTVQLNDNTVPNTLCHVLGYSIIFFFTVSFFWMNVMCIDMWLAFSGIRGFNGKKSAEKKRFIIYCLYAWGVPLLHILTVFLLNTYGDERSAYHPQLGYRKCFVEDGLPNLLYFYLPMAIVIVINIILFILTTIRIQKAKRETSMLKHTDSKRHSYEDDKQKFNLYLKLMLAMGINWSMELISWVVTWKINKSPTWIWYLTDFTNAIYGVVIFFLFVFKKKIWRSLKKRYYVWVGKPHLAHAMSTSASNRGTRTSNFSTTESGVNTDYRLSDIRNVKEEERALNRH